MGGKSTGRGVTSAQNLAGGLVQLVAAAIVRRLKSCPSNWVNLNRVLSKDEKAGAET